MMTAQQARVAADTMLSSKDEFNWSKIKTEIESAVKEPKYSCVMSDITTRNQKRLKEMGYTVSYYSDPRDGGMYTISW